MSTEITLVPRQNSILGCKHIVMVPSNAADYDTLAEREGACVQEALSNVIYRSWNPQVRKALAERIEKDCEFPRGSKTNENGKVSYTETEKTFIDRAVAAGVLTDLQKSQWVNEITADMTLDLTYSERSASFSKEVTAQVDFIFSAIEAGQTNEDRVQNNVAAQLGIPDYATVFGVLSRESLGQALTQLARKKAEEAQRALLG